MLELIGILLIVAWLFIGGLVGSCLLAFDETGSLWRRAAVVAVCGPMIWMIVALQLLAGGIVCASMWILGEQR